jgi:hypothetical protein
MKQVPVSGHGQLFGSVGVGSPSQAPHLAALSSTAAQLSTAAMSASRAAARQNASLRCLCGASGPCPAPPSPVVQCLGEACGVWQHCACVGHTNGPAAGPSAPARAPPERFFCEVCRSARADPFWDVVSNDILPMALVRKTGKQVLVRIWG